MRASGAWFGLGVAAGIVASDTVVPAGPVPAAAAVVVAAGAAVGNPGAWVLVPPCLGLWRAATAGRAHRRVAVREPERIAGTFEVLREEGRGVVLRAGARRLLLGEPPAGVRPGVSFSGELRADPVRGAAEPSAFRAERWARTRGIHGRARLLGPAEPPRDAPGPGAALRRAADAFRARARARLGADRGDSGALLAALLLGDRRGLADEERQAFRRAGLAHVLALSGLHVGVLALGAGSLLRALRLRRGAVLVAMLVFLVAFSYLTGARSPILRAAATSGLAAIGVALGRRFPPGHGVGLVAGMLLLRDPSALGDIGFRLSFTAAALLALAASRPRLPRRRGWRARVGGLAEAAGISAVLTLGSLPEIAASFGVISLLSPVTNLLAGPPAAAALGWGGLSVLAGPGPVGALLADAARLAAAALLAVARAASPVPGGDLPVPALGVPATLVALGAAGHLAAARRPGRPARAILVGGVFLGAAGALPVERLTVLDIGQGSAAILEGGGRAVLVDAGPPPYGDREAPAARAVAHRGLRSLDALVATHGHADHVGGVADVLGRARVARVLAPRRPTALPVPDTWKAARIAAQDDDVPVRHPAGPGAGTPALRDRAAVCSPWPRGRAPLDDENELSLVTRWRPLNGPVAALVTGDLGHPGEAALLDAGSFPLRATVLLAGHHGSRHSTGEEFLAAVRPRLVVVSCGSGNPHGHPHREVVERVRRSGAGLLRTDRDGTVTITATRRGFRVRWERHFPARRTSGSAVFGSGAKAFLLHCAQS